MYTPGARQARANDTPSTRHVQAKHTAAMPPEAAPPLASAHGVTLAAISMQEPFGSLLRQNRRPGWPRGVAQRGRLQLADWPRLPAPKRRRPGLPLWRCVVWSAGAPHSVAGRTSVSPPVIDIGSLLMRGVKTEESRALGTLGDLEGQRLAVRIGYNSWEGPVRGRCEQLPPHLTLTLTLSTLP